MPNTPLVLAFDTSAAHCAAALLLGEQILGQSQEEMAKGQGERLLALCGELLNTAGKEWADLDAIGVGIGPGNFTGIRIAVSAARGLALGLDIPAVGVNAFDALRFGTEGPCVCTVDARREDVFAQGFEIPILSDPSLVPFTDIPPHDGPLIGARGEAPKHLTAVAIAYLAAQRFHNNPGRPAPLYLRPADAAPARDAPPVIVS
ncbi:tRNA (adenosine(37)-N6)-threonylcarbamoyltransferase complex dimerization subunit type 1 TsaB [Sulfitobacter sp. SK012]|uniref:tRNA (adenosine(37)-N6)-threonylcarbamoyltransferase complex dimerization subunit type 1 TsaB n=1 Tax=Sulfitobacter sp. SK012 TaxID=1389005 RepID=UPI000E0AD251|nr:tRNA (adenosine(37)-N6)-threonylcarbamoyltransferase complex dimerization subunit type 1 TsaB [Sulfitobacter sp. SK012]AXI47735.1 tRNA (adenosine(37)-N6)-threonylcarbamoyltransferase complex dimerization subunit type 1 TsaB [Sulfitobacter sp. SK012]